jgi:hypothetical protein
MTVAGRTASAMFIPPEVKQCVVFIFGKLADGRTSAGTGFLVGVGDTAHAGQFYVYLVTARHVLQPIQDEKSVLKAVHHEKNYLPEILVRINRRDGGVELSRVPIVTTGDQRTVYLPRDETIDLAVVPLVLDSKIYEYKVLPDELIVTRQAFRNLGISEGSDVFFTGLFAPYIGERRNNPIMRFGKVALLTAEPVPWGDSKIDLYLMETASFGGNSGSPVFFYLGADRTPNQLTLGPPALYLAGVMKGTFNEEHPIETGGPPKSVESMGIAGVVPAYQLHELLFGPELASLRK